MIANYVKELKALLHAALDPQLSWLARFLGSLLEFVTDPIIGARTRFHWLDILLSLAIVAGVFLWHRRRGPGRGLRGFLRLCFPARLYLRRSTWVDFQLILANHFFANFFMVTWRLNIALMTGGMIAALTWMFGPPPGLLHWNTAMLVAVTFLIFVMDDLGFYLFHLAAHRIPGLWAFHKVHHSAEVLTPLTTGRLHPIEYTIMGPIKAVCISLATAPILYITEGAFTPIQIAGLSIAVAVSYAFGQMLHHSHVWISFGPAVERWIISPAQHHVHHSTDPRHWNKNMAGCFAFWDRLFGTLYVTNGREILNLGLGKDVPQPHTGVISSYLVPFWQAIPMYGRIESWLRQRFGSDLPFDGSGWRNWLWARRHRTMPHAPAATPSKAPAPGPIA
jgi:sterol desaturase/sphingolipid hydroxylase (fatty acid hydroxylase superfamily)